jgi:ferrous iron transport protein B
MSTEDKVKIALVGNTNIGKTTLFNKLCGLNQRTGNYPGVTVDKKKGFLKFGNSDDSKKIEVIDLPGINSLFPSSQDEELVVRYLLNYKSADFPDKIILVVSALNLKRNLFLYEQIRDLNLPMILVVNMLDIAEKKGFFVDLDELQAAVDVPVVGISAKKGQGIEQLTACLTKEVILNPRPSHYLEDDAKLVLKQYSDLQENKNEFVNFLQLTEPLLSFDTARNFVLENKVPVRNWKTNASILRFKFIQAYLDKVVQIDKSKASDLTAKLDRFFLHPVYGILFFFAMMFGIFQAIFWLAGFPMDWIDQGMSSLTLWVGETLPPGYFSQLLTDGLLAGIGGVLIFIPQIAILFLIFSLLEESGYMSRIIYLTDRMMQKFGMSGKSIVPLISGLACAVPAIMATRTIENNRERLITILVTPLLTCSARIPVYVVVIGLVIPDDLFVGIFNAQGLALMGLYLLGILMTFVVAFVLKLVMKPTFKSYLIMEMPEYLLPTVKNVVINVWTNVRSFVWNAGKIILATAVILFVLATNGGDRFDSADQEIEKTHPLATTAEKEVLLAAYKMENSYLGGIGQAIEPVIRPLGYDWKIGIALISSLAAREVFVGTMSIIYSIDSEEEMKIRDRLKNEVNPKTGLPIFGFATSISLLLFYAFSLQCMSTVAVTYKETKSIKWTSVQFIYMTALAYFSALIAFQLLS